MHFYMQKKKLLLRFIMDAATLPKLNHSPEGLKRPRAPLLCLRLVDVALLVHALGGLLALAGGVVLAQLRS